MTTEEIEKAAQVESDKLVFYCSKYDFKRGFIKGFELSNKHWQEKTRWIPTEERLPEVKAHPYQILVKNESIHTMYIASQYDIDLLKDKFLGFTHWKEIK